jgi:hypothetical protein
MTCTFLPPPLIVILGEVGPLMANWLSLTSGNVLVMLKQED